MNNCILIVEDDQSLREILEDVFATEGLSVQTAENGAAAYAKLESGVKPFLILTDNLMPVMNGIDFIRKKNESRWKDIPVILFSANVIDQNIPGVETMNKPFDFLNLMDRVNNYKTNEIGV